MRVKATDLFKIKTLSYPSMVGDAIFYQENWLDEEANTYYSRIRRLDRSTRRQVAYGHDQHHDKKPQLANDGAWLAFLGRDAHKHDQVFIQPLHGGNAQQFTHEPAGISAFDWLADASGIIYTTVTRPVSTSALPQIKIVTKAQYKLNGRGVLPEDGHLLLKTQLLGRKTGHTVFENTKGFSFDGVSPDGKHVAISMDRKPEDPNDFSVVAYLIALKSGRKTDLNKQQPHTQLNVCAFSQDGSQVLLCGNDGETPNVAQNHLWRYDLSTKALSDITAKRDLEINGMVVGDTQQGLSGRIAQFISTDYYAAVGLDHGRASLYAGGPEEALHPLIGGDRQITDFALSSDGRGMIFTCSSLTAPSQLVYFDLISEKETLLVDPNTRYEHNHDLVTPTHYTFKRAGFTLEGWYYAPVKQEAKHPAVLYIHGGPQASYGYTFFHEMQYLASSGYGVICVNPRGGVGYGQQFEAAVIKHYGQEDYEDLLAGVTAAEKVDPQIDDRHVYVTGGSYGGFMTNWIVGHTNRFKAAVTQRSIANWISFYGTSDIGYYFTPWEMSGEWRGNVNDIDYLWQFSPLAYADHVKTPTLILHGEDDQRCPIGQGEEFYVALKLRGVDTKFVRFPRSNHELSRSGLPNLRIERLRQIRQWFDEH